jgi:hypothetical protein
MAKMTPLPGVDWSEHEREQVNRLEALCKNAPHLELECSRTDAGDPWCVIYDREQHRTVLHIARIDRRYLIVWPDQQKSVRTATIAKAVDIAVAEIGPQIAFPRGRGNQLSSRTLRRSFPWV